MNAAPYRFFLLAELLDVYTVRMISENAVNEDAPQDGAINYDSDPVLEIELEGVDYRIDSGKQGLALCVSQRASGTWDWQFIAEAKWDNLDLRCKELPRSTRELLGRALRQLGDS